jgi:hypothetical protein
MEDLTLIEGGPAVPAQGEKKGLGRSAFQGADTIEGIGFS